MLNRERRNREMERGFTLIELMLVIVILGILAGVAVNNFGGVSDDAKRTVAVTDINTIESAIERFEIQMGCYPESLSELTESNDEHREFMKKLPRDPWKSPYNYRAESENGRSFPDIWSNGKDGSEGTEDDIDNWSVDELEDE